MHKGLDSVMRCDGVTYPVVDGCFPLSLHESDHTDFLPRSPWRRSVPALGRTNVEPPVSCPLAAAGLQLTVVIIFRHHLASSRQPPAVLGPSSGPGASQSEVVSLYLKCTRSSKTDQKRQDLKSSFSSLHTRAFLATYMQIK